MTLPLSTIGYERAPLADVIKRLQDGGVELLIDVRAVAASRRAGFSKTMLSGSLAEAGIEYRHLRDLGTPKDGRIAARAGRHAEMQAIFNKHMLEPEALGALETAISLTGIKRACLLCFEHDPTHCHRNLIAERIHDRTGARIVHL
jgi:uncharacterized protein (DUF488 family)